MRHSPTDGEIVAGVSFPRFELRPGEITNLDWPALLDSPETGELRRWLSEKLGLEFVTPQLMIDWIGDSSQPSAMLCTDIARLTEEEGVALAFEIGIDGDTGPNDMRYSDRMLLLAATLLHRDGAVAFTTAGCDPKGAIKLVGAISTLLTSRAALHVSFPPLVEPEEELSFLFAKNVRARAAKLSPSRRLLRFVKRFAQ